MKNTLLLFGFLFASFFAFAQETGVQDPIGWDLNMENTPDVIFFDPLDLESIAKEDRINDANKGQPWRYGIERSIRLDMADGLWTNLPNGARLWQMVLYAPGALNISVNFDKVQIPSGAQFQLYNDEHTDLTNTFTAQDKYVNHQLGTWFVEGDKIWIEYYQPSQVAGTPVLQISSIIHGYRMGLVSDWVSDFRGINDSGACHHDVNCSVGADFDSHKDVLKKAVALLNLGNGFLCSASLINNAKSDKTPFLLTANHCLENSDPALWSVRFNWISPEPVCGTGEDSGDSHTNYTMSGAEFRASNALSDFALVEMANEIPSSWDVAFAGWDNSDTDPLFEVGIHHPNGDIMKVSRDDSGAVKTNANGTETWLIGGGDHGWGNGWEIGSTENGSSGSPLFNESGKIIGQLYAGEAGCDGTESNGEYDLYGRFGVSWHAGNTPETRLSDWLDPENTGLTNVETLQNILSVADIEPTGELKIFPNPATTAITVLNQRYPHLSYEFYSLVGQKLQSGDVSNSMNTISLDHLAEGVYMLKLTDGDTQDTMTKKIVVKR